MARKNRRRTVSSSQKGGFFRKFFLTIFFLMVAAAAVSGFILFETSPPNLSLGKQLHFLGGNVELPITVSDQQSGIRSIEVTLEQGDQRSQLFNRSFQRQAWFTDAGPKSVSETLLIDTNKARLKDGEAALVIRVRDFSLNGMLKGNETSQNIAVIIDSKPPRVSVNHAQQYIRPGGSGIILYTLSEPVERHGVQIDEHFFRGFPLGQSGKQFIAYIALPWDSPEPNQSKVIAVDEAGNEGKAVFTMRYKPIPEKKDRINVSNGFLKNKMPQIAEHYPEMSGNLVERYLYINNTIRQKNAETIKAICQTSEPERLWSGRFGRMAGARKADFADQRTYFYQGQPIDHQTHLGIDLASTARAEVRAANRGKVVFADYLGIYGYMIILDHGQGVFSLYSHLSRLETSVGSLVEKDQYMGNTGATGMAGGDHLHFSMLIQGIFVTPIEWWDRHWIEVNIDAFIGNNQS
ncbi:M23 family metallopeptidase [Desulfogranum mediterraneum]|uniref:M23 family metallopeptidase n=1 Tax=Desulfogranum mediterraneum TaxID=160661 RepID=UPI0004033C2A|nr:M23 family metallopeptidase [Desulfogranum mediterraneum]